MYKSRAFFYLKLLVLSLLFVPSLYAESPSRLPSSEMGRKKRPLQIDRISSSCNDFSGWVTPPPEPAEEEACDRKRIENFAAVQGKCDPPGRKRGSLPFSPVDSYDINHDRCIDCQDYREWKKRISELFHSKQRSTDGSAIRFAACDPVDPSTSPPRKRSGAVASPARR